MLTFYAVCVIELHGARPEFIADLNRWTGSGPEGGRVSAIAVDPQNRGILYTGSFGGGVFKSTDGGSTWRAAPYSRTAPTWVTDLVVDSRANSTVYACAYEGVFKSTDGGNTWISISEIVCNRLALDTQNPTTLYLATNPGVLKSTNGGTSWTETPLTDSSIHDVVVDPKDSKAVYAGGVFGLYKSTDGGISWARTDAPVGDGNWVSRLAVDPQNSEILYVAASRGTFKTVDGGVNWNAADSGLPKLQLSWVRALVVDPADSNIVLAGTSEGLFKSRDGGRTWAIANNILPTAPVNALLFAPDSGTFFAGTDRGFSKSSDKGGSWSSGNSGLSVSIITGLAIDPNNPGTMYAGTEAGLYKRTDGSRGWFELDLGAGVRGITGVAVASSDSNTLYASGGRGSNAVEQRELVFTSVDGGTNWRAIPFCFRPSQVCADYIPVRTVAIDPRNANIVYAGLGDNDLYRGVFKTTDGGANWTWQLTPVVGAITYGLVIDSQNSETVYVASDNGLFKTTNGGTTWSDASAGLPFCRYSVYVGAVAMDPNDSNTLYAGTCHGVFRSTDAGGSWRATDSMPPRSRHNGFLGRMYGARYVPYVSALAVDPRDSRVIYAGSDDGVLKSTDAGMTWKSVQSGLPANTFVTGLSIDAHNPNKVYASTYGGGVFEITFTPPGLTLNASEYCINDAWSLTVTAAPPDSTMRLVGTSNGQLWDVPEWHRTDPNGTYVERGTFVNGTEGTHTLRVEIDWAVSKEISFRVSRCQ